MLTGGLIHCVAWLGFEIVVESVMSASECKEIYGLISGFWAALYFGFVLRVPLSAFVPAALFFVVASWASGSSGIAFPRRASDAGSPGLLSLLPWAILFGLPIVINHWVALVQRLAGAWTQATRADKQ
jgi:hypothetical protein